MIHPMQGCSIEIYITYGHTWQDEAFQCLSATFSLKPRNGFLVGLSMLHRVFVFHKFQMTAQLTVNQYESMQLRCGDLPWHSPWSSLRSPHWPAWFVFSTEPIVGFQLPGCLQWRGSHGWSHIARRLLGLPANMMIDPFPSRMSQSWPNNLGSYIFSRFGHSEKWCHCRNLTPKTITEVGESHLPTWTPTQHTPATTPPCSTMRRFNSWSGKQVRPVIQKLSPVKMAVFVSPAHPWIKAEWKMGSSRVPPATKNTWLRAVNKVFLRCS